MQPACTRGRSPCTGKNTRGKINRYISIFTTLYTDTLKYNLLFTLLISLFTSAAVKAQRQVPDTVKSGIYITSIHDIDFKEKEYTVNLWLWLKYKNKKFDFLQNLEVPQAKSVTRSFSTIDSSDNQIYMLM